MSKLQCKCPAYLPPFFIISPSFSLFLSLSQTHAYTFFCFLSLSLLSHNPAPQEFVQGYCLPPTHTHILSPRPPPAPTPCFLSFPPSLSY